MPYSALTEGPYSVGGCQSAVSVCVSSSVEKLRSAAGCDAADTLLLLYQPTVEKAVQAGGASSSGDATDSEAVNSTTKYAVSCAAIGGAELCGPDCAAPVHGEYCPGDVRAGALPLLR